MNLGDDLWLRPILVEPHAEARIRDRLGWNDRERVAGEIRVALLEGRYSDEQPPWTRHRSRREQPTLKPGRFYAWEHHFLRCWVVQPAGRVLFVVTVLLEQGERGPAAQRRRLRAA